MDFKILRSSDFKFWTSIQTRWSDMDSLNHINHAAYLSFMETARVNVYIELGFPGIKRDMEQSTILASMEVHYMNQAIHPTKLNIGHRVTRVGHKSFDLISAVFNNEDDSLLCAALFKLVSFDYQKNKTIMVPEVIRKRCHPFT